MPPQLLLLIALAALAVSIWLKRLPITERKQALWRVAVPLGVLLLVFAVITGRLHWIVAALGGMAGLLQRLNVVARCYALFKGQSTSSEKNTEDRKETRATSDLMNKADAYAVLGLPPGASEEEIIEAYRRLMQRMHPDRGGSSHLTQKIIQAKKILISE